MLRLKPCYEHHSLDLGFDIQLSVNIRDYYSEGFKENFWLLKKYLFYFKDFQENLPTDSQGGRELRASHSNVPPEFISLCIPLTNLVLWGQCLDPFEGVSVWSSIKWAEWWYLIGRKTSTVTHRVRGSEKMHIQCLAEYLVHEESEPLLTAVVIYILNWLSTCYVPSLGAAQINPTSIPVLKKLTQTRKRKKETERLIWWDMLAS